MQNSTTPAASRPPKPTPTFPLFAHLSGQWCKKLKGKAFYFGSWRSDPTGEQALAVYEAEAPYLKRGEDPPPNAGGLAITLLDLVNLFLEAKENDVDAGVVTMLTFKGYFPTVKRLLAHFGKQRQVETISKQEWSDYRLKLLKQLAPPSVSVEIAKIKAIFHWGAEFDHHHDVKFGKAFARAPKNLVVKYKNEGGKKVYTPEEIHRILGVADRQLRVIVLMAINTSFGNRDLSSLPESALDLQNGWVEFSRVKTGVQRRVPLWPETVKAIREWLPKRPKPTDKDAQGLVFLTSTGRRWIRNEGRSDVLGAKFSRLLKRLKINGRRALGMYSLRHSMATIGANCRDTDAVRAILGHVDQHTSAAYIESISDDRLLAVTETVRVWLFGAEGGAE